MTRTRRLRAAVPAVALVAIAIAIAGFGSSDSGHSGSGTAAGLRAVQEQFVTVVQKVSPSVVQIRTPVDLGSGIVFDRRGDIVTNAHVVGNARRFVVTMASGERHPATVVGKDVNNDLAVIRLTGGRPRPATFADSSKVRVGDIAVALGNPLGLRSSATEGIVSAVGRRVSEANGVGLSSVIQTSAAINPGNSGGALVDVSGRVIGIPTLAALDPNLGGSPAPGIGFAIDSNTVRRVAGKLVGTR